MRSLFVNLRRQRDLLFQLWERDYVARYRGGVLGIGWSVLNPLLTLAMYSFVFVIVFKMRWPSGPDVKGNFVFLLFTGLIVHALFAEMINRAPMLVTSNVSYVKKVVFPLEFLPLMPLLGALLNFGVGLALVLILVFSLQGFIPLTVFLLPLVLIPFLLATLGISYFFAALGVYVRDLAQLVGFIASVSLFASPVLYPLDSVPQHFRYVLYFNPITFTVEELRGLSILGHAPHFAGLAVYTVYALVIFYFGYTWFEKTKRGFADVL